MSARSLSPEEADLMIGRIWYSDQEAKGPVQVHDERVTVPEFDAEKRAAENGGPERVLFVHDLKVEGTLRLGKATGSIYVVLGNIHAGRIELGDAVLAVSGRVTADDYVHAPRTEGGNFAVGSDATSDDATIPALPPVSAPIVVWFDPRRRADLVFTRGEKSLQRVMPDDLPAALKSLYDASTESFTDQGKVLEVLRSGSWKS
jgi:hypothetical protein